ncbi:ActS/PrrB/RegB family redox-sensitive histidine kinase [Cereibacter sphaeroides]|uniref:sensor histidine kinase RegB n=1 Tax=Rhodobacterales TaxID=204455 RepID=UPI000BBE1E0D|nr:MULTISPECIES: ActS/PrrB/RegB family redox-sensitive histidine kinase [Paracoccaceae]MCE6952520.1 ActS/PrrB/RegB family redox-sensitive histidine kinase [Cereibacter sphaeroides]MCE6960036.1 ActS/PrrB/RegB family redox-sensitive histidine kinase [Cereibacter sphaeroides]MCE6968579.1 ActS/PrrB/RegB family redox-sensitive histidine kinase [Cereibacter sphaeroides]MCE6973121.1 ActS/PrrB/RegB family redox-sensitive histidine kinase [Cereibacter sphaeroides]
MILGPDGVLNRDTRGDWVRLRTLILLRWMAVAGQLVAIMVTNWYLGVKLPMGLCFMAVGASVIANVIASFVFPQNRRLTEFQALMILLFDLTQLSFLLFLTGGLTNPFALLILAPVTISALALELRTTVILGAIAIGLLTFTAYFNLPLILSDGSMLVVPRMFEFGFWLAIVVGLLFLGLYSRRVAIEIRSMSDALLATQMALDREQKLTDLGGVVAAAAHELGTPLATIKLVSSELAEELSDRPALRDDAELIRAQADRCRDILRSMGRAGKDDLQMRQAPLGEVLREAAEPHVGRGKRVEFDLYPSRDGDERQPVILRRPEVIHGLRNLIQNAVDFARSTVWIDGEWTGDRIAVRIVDDGEGYPPAIIGRIGDPFVRQRRSEDTQSSRPGYEGMGLGLFIAKTLLERSGAELSFANAADPFLRMHERPERCGAIVEVIWPVSRLVVLRNAPLGENVLIQG